MIIGNCYDLVEIFCVAMLTFKYGLSSKGTMHDNDAILIIECFPQKATHDITTIAS